MSRRRRRLIDVLRPQVNRIAGGAVVLLALPLIVLVDLVRRGSGRKLAVRASRLLSTLCGVEPVVRTSASFDPDLSYVLVANHQTPMDIPALLVACPDVRFVAAAELYKIPLLAPAMRALGTVPLERRNPEYARKQLADLARAEAGNKPRLVIFPEGGILPEDERGRFKSGAFSYAIETGSPVVPVAIRYSPGVLPKRGFLAVRPGSVTVELFAPIPTIGLSVEDRGALRDSAQRIVVGSLGGED